MTQPRIGVYVCWCGTNIAKMVDVEAVSARLKEIKDVIVARDYKYMCSDPGQDLVIKDIKEHNLDRIVVAACSPRIHEATFRKAIEKAGLNPYMFQMANIREQDSWVHDSREKATLKATSLIQAAIKRIRFHEALEKRFVDINSSTLILGGGISGLIAALELAEANNEVYLVEKSDKLGGLLNHIAQSYPYFNNSADFIHSTVSKVLNHKKISVYTELTLKEISGYVGNFRTDFEYKGKNTKLEFGNIMVATGLKPFNPSSVKEYGYTRYSNVITSLEFESLLKKGEIKTSEGKEPESIAIIHCVGSRNSEFHPYCSRTCCQTALKYSNQIRSILPQANIYDVYADMRSYAKGCEELYANSSRRNIMFLMFDQQDGLPRVKENEQTNGGNLLIEFKEKLSGEEIGVEADLIVLMTALEAHDDAKKTAHLVGISACGNEFYIEKHPKLDPVATTTDGVFIVGNCQGPKGIEECISQARAATARILGSIAKGKAEVEVTTAVVNEELCCGCQTCVSVCPYSAITFNSDLKVSNVNDVMCKGCGTCGSACPTGAIRSRHFTDQQILSQIEGILEPELDLI